MITINKQILDVTGTQQLKLPINAHILDVQMQGEDVAMWYKCETTNPDTNVDMFMFGTGEEIPRKLSIRYVATIVMYNGRLVKHVYVGVTK